MSGRRLIKRSRPTLVQDSPIPSRDRLRQAQGTATTTPLPAYEPPSCPLTFAAKEEISRTFTEQSSAKYATHVDTALAAFMNCASEGYDRLVLRKERVERIVNKRVKTDVDDDAAQKSLLAQENEASLYVNGFEKQVDGFNTKAEKAIRDLIDCKDELRSQPSVLDNVVEEVAVAQDRKRKSRRRRRRHDEDEDDYDDDDEDAMDDEQAPAVDAANLSALEISQAKMAEYHTKYTSQSMQTRYAENHSYMDYKRVVHHSMFPPENAPPLPKSSTWFQDGAPQSTAAARRRTMAKREEPSDGEDEESELVVTNEKINFNDPLELKPMTNPLSSTVCKHHYQRETILAFIREQGRVEKAGDRKQIECPVIGCGVKLGENDLRVDPVFRRKLERAMREEAQENDDGPMED